jgi:hypothetical protein
LQNCVNQDFDDPVLCSVRTNTTLCDQFVKCMVEIRRSIEIPEFPDTRAAHTVVSLSALTAFLLLLYRTDKRLVPVVNEVWALHRVLPVVHLYADIAIAPNEFLESVHRGIKQVIDKKLLDSSAALKKDYLAKRAATFARYHLLCVLLLTIACISSVINELFFFYYIKASFAD